MAKYTFDQYAVFKGKEKANPETIGERLELIASQNGGRLMPLAVVTDARKRGSPLHQHFEWNVQRAAEAHWLDQARALIRSVRIVSDDNDEAQRPAFLTISDKGGVAYHTVSEVLGNREMQLIVLRQAERDLIAFERRYRDLQEICQLVRDARQRVADRIRSEQESRPQA